MADILPRILKAYRANPATGKKETLPKSFDRGEIINLTRGMDTSLALGMPAVGKAEVVNKILKEGRGDAGTNSYNVDNPKAVALFQKLVQDNITAPLGAAYAAAVLDKSQVASRLGTTFERAWNGTKTSSVTGKSGQWHSDTYNQSRAAKDFPENAELVDLVKRSASNNLTSQEHLLAMDNKKLAAALMNIPPELLMENDTTYSPQAIKAANTKLGDARDRATHQERKDSKLLYGTDALNGVTTAYLKASGVEPPKYRADAYVNELASDPVMKYLVGDVAPPPSKPTLVESPSILDTILSYFK
jgi:hypothetical protein